jgi:serine/threonine protein kinase
MVQCNARLRDLNHHASLCRSSGKDVRSSLFSEAAVQIKYKHILKTLLEVAYAMRHLHSMHILHRDLKIQNVLLKSSNKDSRCFTVKVSDFGLAKVWDGRGRGMSPSERQAYAGASVLQKQRLAPSIVIPPFSSPLCQFGVSVVLATQMRLGGFEKVAFHVV